MSLSLRRSLPWLASRRVVARAMGARRLCDDATKKEDLLKEVTVGKHALRKSNLRGDDAKKLASLLEKSKAPDFDVEAALAELGVDDAVEALEDDVDSFEAGLWPKKPQTDGDEDGEGGADAEFDPGVPGIDFDLEPMQEQAVAAYLQKRLGPRGAPELRELPDEPLDSVLETWSPRHLVSSRMEDNVLVFKTRYYMSAVADHEQQGRKVVMTARVRDLGLTKLEQKRLISVAGQRVHRKRGELKLVCDLHEQPHLNKAEMRRILNLLLEDARENAVAHSQLDDSCLPLKDRKEPWQARYKSTRTKPLPRYQDRVPREFRAWQDEKVRQAPSAESAAPES